MKINASQPLLNFKGKPLQTADKEDFTLGKALAEILLADKSGGKMKLYNLAESFYKNKSVEIDSADFSMVKQAVEKANPEAFSNLITGQVLNMLENVKETK